MNFAGRITFVVLTFGLILPLAGLDVAFASNDGSTPISGKLEGYAKVDFDRLAAFKVTPPPFDANAKPGSAGPSLGNQIPDAIRGLDGRPAIVTGFMLPIKMEGGLVTEFLLMRSQMMCCYGVVPQVNEWILVRMARGVHQLMDVPVSFGGKLRVKELYENGFLTAIYQLDGEKMVPTKS
jgi:hypothetical protein